MEINWDEAPDEAVAIGKVGIGKQLVWLFQDGYQYVNKSNGKFHFNGGGVTYGEHEIDVILKKEDWQLWPSEERINAIEQNGGTGEHYTAAKLDADKPMYNLLPPVAVDLMAQVMTFGAKKYKPESWRTVPDAIPRYQAALLRHSFAMLRGDVIDQESGLPHAAHAMCCAAFLAELQGA